jgi:hypothetical protein
MQKLKTETGELKKNNQTSKLENFYYFRNLTNINFYALDKHKFCGIIYIKRRKMEGEK